MLLRLLRAARRVRCEAALGAVMAAALLGAGGTNEAGAGISVGDWSFTGVGDLPGGGFQSSVAALSPDGAIAVGSSFTGPSTTTMFRWTHSGGMVPLTSEMRPHAVNTDGSIIVGDGVIGFSVRSARWTSATGVQLLEPLGNGVVSSQAFAASADGSIIVGVRDDTDGDDSMSTSPGSQAFRWTADFGIELLGDLSGGHVESFAYGISADGAVIVGYGTDSGSSKAFRWTAGGGMQSLGVLAGIGESRANAVSADGSTIVGYSSIPGGTEAFRWTSTGGMVGLGDLPTGPFYSEARAVSGDGSAIVGYGYIGDHLGFNTERAFLWTPGQGMRDLKTVLQTDFGLNLAGWDLFRGTAISADGKTIAGSGRNPSGNFEGWVAVIPEPTSLALIGLGAVALRRRRRR